MKVKELLPLIQNTTREVVVEIPQDEFGSHRFIYGLDNITPDITNEDVCFIVPYESLNRLIICISNGELKCRSSMVLMFL